LHQSRPDQLDGSKYIQLVGRTWAFANDTVRPKADFHRIEKSIME